MVQRFQTKDFPKIDSLHDCETMSIELSENKLVLIFNKRGLGILLPTGEEMYPYNQLKLTYVLDKDFNYNETDDSSVSQTKKREKLVRKAIKQFSLINFVKSLNEKHENLRFYSQYYSQGKCIIFVELINKKGWQMGNWFEIELLVDEIIYEWS